MTYTPEQVELLFTPELVEPGVIKFKTWDTRYFKQATAGLCSWAIDGANLRCSQLAYWCSENDTSNWRCPAHGGYDPTNPIEFPVADGWVRDTSGGTYGCEHPDCVDPQHNGPYNGSNGRGTWAYVAGPDWFLNLPDGSSVHYVCNWHVPRVGMPGMHAPEPEVAPPEYPFWLTAEHVEQFWNRRRHVFPVRVEGLRVYVTGSSSYTHHIQRGDVPGILRLLARVNYGIKVYDAGTAYVEPLRQMLNKAEVERRRQTRMGVAEARRRVTQMVQQWEALKAVRAQYVPVELLEALADDVSTWPEVIQVVKPGQSIELAGSRHLAIASISGIIVQFWPVFYDDVEGVRGLTAPMAFSVEVDGAVRWVGGYGDSAHPHAYENAGEVCHGEAHFEGAGIARALGDLRNWWVGTDGGPANTNWGTPPH
jgi:hypothetical protein